MKKSVIKDGQYKRVLITWIDSTARVNKIWWRFVDILNDIKDSEKGEYFYSVGYLFKETKLNYYLANSLHFENKKVVSVGQIFSIPKGCAIKIEHLNK